MGHQLQMFWQREWRLTESPCAGFVISEAMTSTYGGSERCATVLVVVGMDSDMRLRDRIA